LRDEDKKKERVIADLKNKSEDLNKKIKDLKAETAKIDAERE
jgi:chaperonin cofactor prefoldin